MQAAAKMDSEVIAGLGPTSQSEPACEVSNYSAVFLRGVRNERNDT
jgi:hypothetical protein